MLFVRWNIPERSHIVASRCDACDRLVGWSPSPDILSLVEEAHASCSHAGSAPGALKIRSMDALLYSALEPALRSR
jgi:hypothetical protein